MELNFDKEMDALLRQAAQQEITAQPAAPAHLDADELAAFARNALPVKARTRAMEHLVDCGNCRTVLSNLVFFENQEEAAPVPLVNKVESRASWLENITAFFTMPALAYGMAGLILVFAGLLVFTIFRSSQNETTVAQANDAALEKPQNAKGAPLDGDENSAAGLLANTNSSTSMTNAAVAANNAATGAFSPYQPGTSNSAANIPFTETDPAKAGEFPEPKLADKTDTKEAAATFGAGKPEEQREPQPVTRQQDNYKQQRNETLDKDNYRSNNNILTPDGGDRKRSPAPPPPQATAGAPARDAARDAERGDDEVSKSASMGPLKKKVKGREFRKDGAVWVDTAYRGQATVNITRESKEFKKLDDGLRKIARELAGTIIVVWKESAYRIQ